LRIASAAACRVGAWWRQARASSKLSNASSILSSAAQPSASKAKLAIMSTTAAARTLGGEEGCGCSLTRVGPQGRPMRVMKHSAPLCNKSVGTGGGTPEGGNHRRGGPHMGPTQETHRHSYSLRLTRDLTG